MSTFYSIFVVGTIVSALAFGVSNKIAEEADREERMKQVPKYEEIARAIPAVYIQRNIDAYTKLTELDPTNGAYYDKIRKYEAKARQRNLTVSASRSNCRSFAKHSLKYPHTFKLQNLGSKVSEKNGTIVAEYLFTGTNAFGVPTRFLTNCEYDLSGQPVSQPVTVRW